MILTEVSFIERYPNRKVRYHENLWDVTGLKKFDGCFSGRYCEVLEFEVWTKKGFFSCD